MTRQRLQEIRRAAKELAPEVRLLIEELAIAVEGTKQAKELTLSDPTKPATKARGTLQEFETFAESIKLPKSDGAFFYHKLVAQDWKVAGKPIRCWQSGIRQWKAAGYLPSQKNTRSGTSNGNGAHQTARTLL